MKYACIARHCGEFTVRLMCRVLEVAPSGFYAWRVRAPSERAQREERLRLHIRALHRTTRERYGALKLHCELSSQGVKCGHNRVARLMREEGLRARRARRFRVTTQSAHNYPLAQNRLERRFELSDNHQINRVWAADITYLPTREGWLYLTVVLDVRPGA